MNMAEFKRFSLAFLIAWLVAVGPTVPLANADPNDGSGEGPDYSGISEGFSLGFANTYGYDYCNDTEIGDGLRKVWWRLLDYCDLTPHQRSVIRENFEWATKNIPPQIPEMRKQWALPVDPNSDEAASRYFYGRFRCDQDSYRKKKAKIAAILEEIEQGHAGPEAILPDPCTQ